MPLRGGKQAPDLRPDGLRWTGGRQGRNKPETVSLVNTQRLSKPWLRSVSINILRVDFHAAATAAEAQKACAGEVFPYPPKSLRNSIRENDSPAQKSVHVHISLCTFWAHYRRPALFFLSGKDSF